MKEKFTMTAFAGSQMADAAISTLAICTGALETGPFMGLVVEKGGLDQALITKMAITVVLIGLYAISNKNESKYFKPIDKALRLGNLITWGVVALQTVGMIGYFK
jgi:hypothetical protein